MIFAATKTKEPEIVRAHVRRGGTLTLHTKDGGKQLAAKLIAIEGNVALFEFEIPGDLAVREESPRRVRSVGGLTEAVTGDLFEGTRAIA